MTRLRGARPRPEIAVLLLLALAALAVWPFGAYALGDDWAHARALADLRDGGELRGLDGAAPRLAHLAWGWLWSAPFGFSFTAARLSVLALAAVCVLALAAFLRQAGASRRVVLFAGLALAFHPLFFFRSLAFASEVPAAAWTSCALLAFARGLAPTAGPRAGWLGLGSLLAGVGAGVQPAALLVVLAAGVELARRGARAPLAWLAAVAPGLLLALGFAWLAPDGHGPLDAARRALAGWTAPGSGGLDAAAWAACAVAALAAGFGLPLLLALPLRAFRPAPGWRGAAVLGLAAASLAIVALRTNDPERLFPWLPDTWTRFGFWNPNLVLLGARPPLLSDELAFALSALLLLAPALLCLAAARAGAVAPAASDARRVALRLAGVLLALQLGLALARAPLCFDRDLVTLAPTLLAFAALASREQPRWLPFLALWLPLGGFALAASHDAHAAARAVFRAGQDLLAEGVDPARVDAGLAFAGWHMAARSQAELAAGLPPLWRGGRGGTTSDPWYLREVAPRVLSQFKVTLSEEPKVERWIEVVSPESRGRALLASWSQHRVLRRVAWRSFWPWERREVFVLEDRGASDHAGPRAR